MRKTLHNIAKKMTMENISWLLAGNTAAVLQGGLIESHKLTFYMSRIDSYKFGELFSEHKKERVKHREKSVLAGHIGLFVINGIEIIVVGEPSISFQHRNFQIPIDNILEDIETIQIEDQDIPLLPLPWLLILGLMGNDKKLVKAVSTCELDESIVTSIAVNMGISYYLKPELQKIFG